MNKIVVYNVKNEDHSQEPNNYYIGRSKGGNPLANPFGIGGKRPSFAKMTFPTREEAIEAYRLYFKSAYGKDAALTVAFDEIYEHYKNGEDVYLQCFCKPLKCHGDVLAEELQKKLVIENMNALRKKKLDEPKKADEE